MRITLGGADAGMTEKNLDDSEVGAVLQQSRGITVPEPMRLEILFNACSFTGDMKGE